MKILGRSPSLILAFKEMTALHRFSATPKRSSHPNNGHLFVATLDVGPTFGHVMLTWRTRRISGGEESGIGHGIHVAAS